MSIPPPPAAVTGIPYKANNHNLQATGAFYQPPVRQPPAPAQDLASRKPKRTVRPTATFDGSKGYGGVDSGGAGNQAYGGSAEDDDDETRRVTVWNPKTGKKLSGNAGVFKRNLARYLRTHPDWIVWSGQDKEAFRKKRFQVQEQSPKRKRVHDYESNYDNKRRAIESLEDEMPTAASLWKSLLAVCSESSILAEVDGMVSDEEEEEALPMRTGGYRRESFSPQMVHGGLMSPAVG